MPTDHRSQDWKTLQLVLDRAVDDGAGDQKRVYRDIRNFLAGRVVGATRDEALLDEVVKCLLCKVFLVNGSASDDRGHAAGAYREAFAQLQPTLHGFDPGEPIRLDDEAIEYVDFKLSSLDLHEPTRDPLGDLYETFIGPAVRGQEGQFFTPLNAVELLIALVHPQPGERILDPASGAGGFLSGAARHLVRFGADRLAVADCLYGIEKDEYLASLAQRHVVVAATAPAHIFCGDSLAWVDRDGQPLPIPESGFDVILTNPPFGARIVSASDVVRARFQLACKWTSNAAGGFTRTNVLQRNVPPQVLFLERCLQLVRPGGRVGMVVPESLLSGGGYAYVRHFLLERARVDAVVGMPESLFKTSGKGGTHTKTALLVVTRGESDEAHPVFMAEATWCGHDSRGNPIPHDDLPAIAEHFRAGYGRKKPRAGWLGFHVKHLRNDVLAPRYYDPEVERELASVKKTHHLVVLGDLVADGRLELRTGDEVGKLGYLRDGVPFVRTSDISNWEIKVDPKHWVDRQTFKRLRKKQDVRVHDLLMVKDGTYLIGTCALVTRHDMEIVYQSHLYKIRIRDDDELLNPWLLLAILTSPVVRRQIRAKSFTQDIIDSLGRRVLELVLPVPRDENERRRITDMVRHVIDSRVEARELARRVALEVAPVAALDEGDCD